MPQDTLWLNGKGGNFVIYDHDQITDATLIKQIVNSTSTDSVTEYAFSQHNNSHNDSLLQTLISFQRFNKENKFLEEKDYYDRLGNKLEFVIILIFIAFIFYAFYRKNKKKNNPYAEDDNEWIEIGTRRTNYFEEKEYEQPIVKTSNNFLVYKGKDLKFSAEEIATILHKHFPYFEKLSTGEKIRFLQRLNKFMYQKVFRIHDESGFKEMPILISATAIQLSFGLEDYILPYYKNINIFPQEFLGIEPQIRFLEGNVSGNSINISWKHYLQGYENIENGQNVGLHEMAHAYYCQNMVCDEDRNPAFVSAYSNFDVLSNTVFKNEILSTQRLYSDYGLKNLHEFWAESVEIFFERPLAMKAQYPDLFTTMSLLLNQQPA